MFRNVSLSTPHSEFQNKEIAPLTGQWRIVYLFLWGTFTFNLNPFINETAALTKWERNLKIPAWEFHIIHLILKRKGK